MTYYIVEGAVELLNYSLSKSILYETIRTLMIVEGKLKIDMGKMIKFDTYAMVYVMTKIL